MAGTFSSVGHRHEEQFNDMMDEGIKEPKVRMYELSAVRASQFLLLTMIKLSVLLCLFCSLALSQEPPLLKFSIADQFDSLRTEKDYLGSVTIVIGSDKGGSTYNGNWHKAIADSLAGKIDNSMPRFLPVADVSSVPFFLKGFVKGKFPQTKKDWVLMDWKGYFADTYRFSSDSTNICIIDKNGALVYKTAGQTLDDRKLSTICAKIIELVRTAR